jgi:membrane protein YqaA with SNARE-associated domain
MLIDLVPAVRKKRSGGLTATLRHWGAFGLFSLAIVDSLPLPTFGGPDILTAILAARHRDPWFVYAAVATAGSLIGAMITFRLARRAGLAYLNKHFGGSRVATVLRLFETWGTGALAVSTAVPFPSPTTIFFAAAGASGYSTRKYLTVVGLCRAARYSLIAFLAERYGRHFTRVILHPAQYWGWLLLFAAIIAGVVASGIVINRRLEASSSSG